MLGTMDQDVRIEDYLNDKLQTQTDLASIDSLLEDLQKQHSLLSQQVRPLAYRLVLR